MIDSKVNGFSGWWGYIAEVVLHTARMASPTRIDKDRASYHNKIIEAHNRTKEWDGWDRMSSRGS